MVGIFDYMAVLIFLMSSIIVNIDNVHVNLTPDRDISNTNNNLNTNNNSNNNQNNSGLAVDTSNNPDANIEIHPAPANLHSNIPYITCEVSKVKTANDVFSYVFSLPKEQILEGIERVKPILLSHKAIARGTGGGNMAISYFDMCLVKAFLSVNSPALTITSNS